MKLLEQEYQKATTYSSDISNHVPVLKKFSEVCNHITEFGFRKGVSTIAFMASRPKKIISYDIVPCPIAQHKQIAEEENIDFKFIMESSIEVTIEKTDLLFIDSLHTYTQVKTELDMHHKKVKKFIVAHDTQFFARHGGGGLNVGTCPFHKSKGVRTAIEEFLQENNNWIVIYDDKKDKYGLMILVNTNNMKEKEYEDILESL